MVFCLLWGSGIPRRAQACAWLALAEVVGPVQRPVESLAHVLLVLGAPGVFGWAVSLPSVARSLLWPLPWLYQCLELH